MIAPVIAAAALVAVLAAGIAHAWWRLDRAGRENRRLRTQAATAHRRGYEAGWADAEWTYGQQLGAERDAAALARHHTLCARRGIRPMWGRGVTNRPETS